MEAILIELIGISITTLLAVAHYGGIRICKTEHLFVLTLEYLYSKSTMPNRLTSRVIV